MASFSIGLRRFAKWQAWLDAAATHKKAAYTAARKRAE